MIEDKSNRECNHVTKENVTRLFGKNSFEERKIEMWEKLIQSYTPRQLAELNKTGYTTLTRKQLHIVYGPNSPLNNSEALHRLRQLNTSEIDKIMLEDIKKISRATSFRLRLKDILSPTLFAATINAYPALNGIIALSPIAFSPVIQTPVVVGIVVLSPIFFSPLILSLIVANALILSPDVFSPIILTSMVLFPEVFVPGIFNPKILSPRVLVPHIMDPQVFSPFILSPLVLSPVILTPGVGLPLILSPFALTPLTYSPQVFMRIILSPYALSSNVNSTLRASIIVFRLVF